MSVPFARAAVVPVWMVLFALIALLAPPFGATTRILLLGLASVGSVLLALMVSALLAPVPRRGTPHGAVVEVLPSIDVDSWMGVVPVTRRARGIVVGGGGRFWNVEGVPVHGRTRHDATDHHNSSRGRARWATADAVSS